jgi:hypothetical protein
MVGYSDRSKQETKGIKNDAALKPIPANYLNTSSDPWHGKDTRGMD